MSASGSAGSTLSKVTLYGFRSPLTNKQTNKQTNGIGMATNRFFGRLFFSQACRPGAHGQRGGGHRQKGAKVHSQQEKRRAGARTGQQGGPQQNRRTLPGAAQVLPVERNGDEPAIALSELPGLTYAGAQRLSNRNDGRTGRSCPLGPVVSSAIYQKLV